MENTLSQPYWKRKIKLRWTEWLKGASKKSHIKTDKKQVNKTSIEKPKSNLPGKHHPNEAPCIDPKEYGNIRFDFKHPNAMGFVDPKGDNLKFKDLYEHLIVFGGSGTGKTYTVLGPLWEELFRSTHLPYGPEREEKKFGAFVIEAKGDFRDKTWYLAQKYGRIDDCVFFGPTHRDVVYDLFGDPTESTLQMANKMLAIMKAMSDGKGTADPFWDNAARKLFLNTFLMHRLLMTASRESTDEGEKRAYKVDPMSFKMMSLLLMDRGQPRNAGEIQQVQDAYLKAWNEYREALGKIQSICTRVEFELDKLCIISEDLENKINAESQALSKEVEDIFEKTEMTEEALDVWRIQISAKKEAVSNRRAAIAGLKHLVYGPTIDASEEDKVVNKCVQLRKNITDLFSTQDDRQRAQFANKSNALALEISNNFRRRITSLDLLKEQLGEQIKEQLLNFIETSDKAISARTKLSAARPASPEYGALRKMLTQYEELVKKRGEKPQLDPIWAYFNEEYLNVANDKTAGSVAMVASNVVAMFIHPPFSEIFNHKATFNFNNAIDEGKIVYLDMPTVFYGATAVAASLVLKIDFFRAMLSRARLTRRNVDGTMSKIPINQVRPMSYFCDEFASVVTTGDETGEAGFMDKVREFKCACLLGTQSLPMLLKKMTDNECDAIMTNTAFKIFLRNTDQKTNKFASDLLGTEIKVHATINQSAAEHTFSENKAIGHRPFTTSHQKGARYDVGDFTKLLMGNAIVCLNPRFGKNQIQKVQFGGRSIEPPDPKNPNMFELPRTHPEGS